MMWLSHLDGQSPMSESQLYLHFFFFFSGGDRPATAVHMFNKTKDCLKVTWQSNYQMHGQNLHYIV